MYDFIMIISCFVLWSGVMFKIMHHEKKLIQNNCFKKHLGSK